MKELYILFITLISFSFTTKKDKTASDDYRDIANVISTNDFEAIKAFILKNGDRTFYCNKYNNSPHYAFDGFDVFLDPEIGQANGNCDTTLSDFNQLVIRDLHDKPQYYHLLIVRTSDLSDDQIIDTREGMKENKVYLLKHQTYDIDLMKDKVVAYIDKMKRKIK